MAVYKVSFTFRDQEYVHLVERPEVQRVYSGIVHDAIRELGVVARRGEDRDVVVKVLRGIVHKGELSFSLLNEVYCPLPVEALDQSSYDAALDNLLQGLPAEFHEFVSSQAYERGHSSGFDECLNIATDLVYDLEKAINAYNKRIKESK